MEVKQYAAKERCKFRRRTEGRKFQFLYDLGREEVEVCNSRGTTASRLNSPEAPPLRAWKSPGDWLPVTLKFIIRHVQLVFFPVSGTDILKPLEFLK